MPINPEKVRLRQLLAAKGYLELDLPKLAIRELDQIDDLGPCVYEGSLLRGNAFRRLEDYQRGLDSFRTAHIEKPTDVDALMGMAWCFKRIDQLQYAIDAMKLAYQFHKDEPVVLYNLACYYSLAGEKDNALSWLGRSLRMNRDLLNLIPEETDFDSLREDADFQHLLELTSLKE
jgi:tetratricopeptide (TPR) repeat protein